MKFNVSKNTLYSTLIIVVLANPAFYSPSKKAHNFDKLGEIKGYGFEVLFMFIS